MQNLTHKQNVFKALLVVSPLLLLLAVEGALRLFNYGGNLSLVVEPAADGKRVYALNSRVTRRYFTQKDIVPAVAAEQTFAKEKPAGTCRIFCLGESTTYGFPYPPNINFPIFLEQRLRTFFPERRFEVINVGVTAISSFAVVDFVQELVRYEPDLFLIYMGHNEFYGALGAASTENFGQSRALIKSHLYLQNCKIYLLLKDLVNRLAAIFRGTSGKRVEGRNLMERMAGKTSIAPDGAEHQVAVRNFRENLLEMIEIIQRHGAKVLVSTLVSNLKDQPPFATAPMPSDKRREWENGVQQGDDSRAKGDSAAAAFFYQRAAEVFPESAEIHFILGGRYLALGDRAKARDHFHAARDRDLMPFRARSEFNRVLAEVGAARGVPVVPMHEVFNLNSRDGIPGREVFTEHVHPNHLGYFLMAQQFLAGIYDNDCLAPKSSWDLSRQLTDEAYWKMAAVTPLDVAIGAMRTEVLKKSWPFQTTPLPDSLRLPKLATAMDSIAFDHIAYRIDWATAHLRAAKFLIAKGQAAAAQSEYEAILNLWPEHLEAQLGLAGLHYRAKQYHAAESLLVQLAARHPDSPYPAARLGLVYLVVQQNEKAMRFLEKAVIAAAKRANMPAGDLLEMQYHLALAYALGGAREKAKVLLREILLKNPRHAEAQSLFEKLNL